GHLNVANLSDCISCHGAGKKRGRRASIESEGVESLAHFTQVQLPQGCPMDSGLRMQGACPVGIGLGFTAARGFIEERATAPEYLEKSTVSLVEATRRPPGRPIKLTPFAKSGATGTMPRDWPSFDSSSMARLDRLFAETIWHATK